MISYLSVTLTRGQNIPTILRTSFKYRPSANCPFRSEVMVPKEQARVAASTESSERHGEGDDEGILMSRKSCARKVRLSAKVQCYHSAQLPVLSLQLSVSASVSESRAGTARIGVGRGWLLGWEGKSFLGVYSMCLMCSCGLRDERHL